MVEPISQYVRTVASNMQRDAPSSFLEFTDFIICELSYDKTVFWYFTNIVQKLKKKKN